MFRVFLFVVYLAITSPSYAAPTPKSGKKSTWSMRQAQTKISELEKRVAILETERNKMLGVLERAMDDRSRAVEMWHKAQSERDLLADIYRKNMLVAAKDSQNHLAVLQAIDKGATPQAVLDGVLTVWSASIAARFLASKEGREAVDDLKKQEPKPPGTAPNLQTLPVPKPTGGNTD